MSILFAFPETAICPCGRPLRQPDGELSRERRLKIEPNREAPFDVITKTCYWCTVIAVWQKPDKDQPRWGIAFQCCRCSCWQSELHGAYCLSCKLEKLGVDRPRDKMAILAEGDVPMGATKSGLIGDFLRCVLAGLPGFVEG